MTTVFASRRAAGSLCCGLAAAAAILGATRWIAPATIDGPVSEGGWTGRSRGWFLTRGFFPAETDPHDQSHYSWTGETVRIEIPHLDRSEPYEVTLEVAAVRPPGVDMPALGIAVDGVPAGTFPVTIAPQPVTVRLLPRTLNRAVLTLSVSNTFVPSARDTRPLGVMVRRLTIAAGRHFSPTWGVTAEVAGAAALTMAATLICGVTGLLAWLIGAGIAASFAWLALQDGAFIGTYPDALFHVALGAAVVGGVVGAIRAWPAAVSKVPDWPLAVGLVLAATTAKLAFLGHPLATVGDGIFQIHRAQVVHAGTYFFTSITPRPFFEFPYAIALYVTAMPFWRHFPSDLDQVHLLRGLAVLADALAGLACAIAVFRQWRSRTAMLLVAGLSPFARAPLEALCNSNLTNVFGQGLFGAGLGAVAWMAAGGVSWPAAIIGTVCLTAGFLGHFSTFSVGVPLAAAVGGALLLGAARERRVGVWVLAMTAVAVGISYAVYYSHFLAVYQATWARILAHQTTEVTGSAIAAPPLVKLQRWLAGTSDDYGLPGLVLAIAAIVGAVRLARERPREGVTLLLGGWLAVWLGFTALGILTAIQMRVNLAAAPLFTCLGAYALGAPAPGSKSRTIIVGALAAAIVWSGLRIWFMCLGR